MVSFNSRYFKCIHTENNNEFIDILSIFIQKIIMNFAQVLKLNAIASNQNLF